MTFSHRLVAAVVLALSGLCLLGHQLLACTGITLKAKDGAVVFGRTLEWGPFDLKSRLVIVPRATSSPAHARRQAGDVLAREIWCRGPGRRWKGHRPRRDERKGAARSACSIIPGFAEYQKYDPARAGESLAPTDIGQYLLTTCASVDEARTAMAKVRVVAGGRRIPRHRAAAFTSS